MACKSLITAGFTRDVNSTDNRHCKDRTSVDQTELYLCVRALSYHLLVETLKSLESILLYQKMLLANKQE